MREGWQGVAVVTGSRPSLAQQVLIGITISVKGEGAGKGGTEAFISPSILCSCTAVCFRAVFPPMSYPVGAMPCPPPRICWWSVSILSISFHFSCSGCTRINNYRPLSPHRSLSLPSPDLFSNHFCLPLNASSSFSTPSCHLSIITLLGDRKQSPRAALQMKMKRAGRQETKMVGQGREEEQEKGAGGHSNQYLCWEGAIFHAVLLLFYYFSGFLVFRSRPGREPAAVAAPF